LHIVPSQPYESITEWQSVVQNQPQATRSVVIYGELTF